jgi:hypothetical protein
MAAPDTTAAALVETPRLGHCRHCGWVKHPGEVCGACGTPPAAPAVSSTGGDADTPPDDAPPRDVRAVAHRKALDAIRDSGARPPLYSVRAAMLDAAVDHVWAAARKPLLAEIAGLRESIGARAILDAQRERDEIADELAEAREVAQTCTCYDGNPANYDGPQADCAVHGAIRAFNEASRDLNRTRAELAEAVSERDKARDAHDLACTARDMLTEDKRRYQFALRALTTSQDGDALDVDTEIPVGEIRRLIVEAGLPDPAEET